MTSEVEALLRKARRSLQASDLMLSQGLPEKAASEAYYAMFYAAKAMLVSRTPRVTRHRDVIAKFREQFTDGGKIEEKFAEYLDGGFKTRHLATYETDPIFAISSQGGKSWLENAKEFVAMAEEFLKRAEP